MRVAQELWNPKDLMECSLIDGEAKEQAQTEKVSIINLLQERKEAKNYLKQYIRRKK